LSCEALIRWQHPTKGLVYPDYFIDIAEETGQIIEVGKCIIDKACRQMAKWRKTAPVDIVMALNISPQQLYDKHLVDFFDRKLLQYGLKPEHFEIEITETALLKHTSILLSNLEQFVQRGFGLALDDFGTGFSSIQHLQSFPISTVKIDRSLMPNNDSPKRTLSLLKGLVAMVQSMDLSIVAEGIEDDVNAALCHALGVERLQGYHFSKPVQAEEFERRFLFAHLMEKLAV
jgi:EAL domain-containing protein (putative c-di-GMP-specific phosphodiesterase class I)